MSENLILYIVVRDNSSGAMNNATYDSCSPDFDEYIWKEGNYSCDCNRKILFDGAGYQDDIECSDGKYSIQIRNIQGELLYDEL